MCKIDDILLLFSNSKWIKQSYFYKLGISQDEIDKQLMLGNIIQIGMDAKNPAFTDDDPKYTITKKGQDERNKRN